MSLFLSLKNDYAFRGALWEIQTDQTKFYNFEKKQKQKTTSNH